MEIGRRSGKSAGGKWDPLFDKVKRKSDDTGGAQQKKIESFIEDFGPELRAAINNLQEGELFAIVQEAKLKGFSGKRDPTLVAKAMAQQEALEEDKE